MARAANRDRLEARQMAEVVEQKKEPDVESPQAEPVEPQEVEPRQVTVVEQKKMPVPEIRQEKKAPEVEARYSAFLERWRGRISIGRDEMAAWEYEQTEELEGLLDEAMRRGDLWRIGDFYGQTFKTMARFSNPHA